MARTAEVKVPDIGGFSGAEVIEVLVAPGARVALDQALVTLSSDKASMDVPSPHAGTVREVRVTKGAKVSEGDVLMVMEVEAGAALAQPGPEPENPHPGPLPGGEGAPARPVTVVESGAEEVKSDLQAEIVVL